MLIDTYGLSLSTKSDDAVGAFNRGVYGLLAWDRRTVGSFREAATIDPTLGIAHAGLATALFVEERFDEARAAMAVAHAAGAKGSEREQSQLVALDHYVNLRGADAEAAMRAHMTAYPYDLMIAQRR